MFRVRPATRHALWIAASFGLGSLLLALACVNAPSVEERVTQRIVATLSDPNANFTAYTTFAMPDSIVGVSSIDGGLGGTQTLSPEVADPILAEIASELTSRGYTRVARNQGPDLGVGVTGLNRLRVNTVGYGGWWGTGSQSSAFWGYPSSPFSAPWVIYQTVAWQSGTLVIELDDLRQARAQAGAPGPGSTVTLTTLDAPASIPVVWVALIHGVIGAVGATLTVPPIASIQQAFAQSPYLHR
jgi:hypothetical protein